MRPDNYEKLAPSSVEDIKPGDWVEVEYQPVNSNTRYKFEGEAYAYGESPALGVGGQAIRDSQRQPYSYAQVVAVWRKRVELPTVSGYYLIKPDLTDLCDDEKGDEYYTHVEVTILYLTTDGKWYDVTSTSRKPLHSLHYVKNAHKWGLLHRFTGMSPLPTNKVVNA